MIIFKTADMRFQQITAGNMQFYDNDKDFVENNTVYKIHSKHEKRTINYP